MAVDRTLSEAVRVGELVDAGGFGNAMFEGWGSVASDARGGTSTTSTRMFWVSVINCN